LPSINTGVAVLSGVTLAPEAKSGRIEFKATISAGASSLNGILLLKMNRRTAFQWKFSSSGPRLAADARTTIHGQKKKSKKNCFCLGACYYLFGYRVTGFSKHPSLRAIS